MRAGVTIVSADKGDVRACDGDLNPSAVHLVGFPPLGRLGLPAYFRFFSKMSGCEQLLACEMDLGST
jgi:hypothetical protein